MNKSFQILISILSVHRRRWTWEAVLGALCLFTALILPYVVALGPENKLVDILIAVGGALSLAAEGVPRPGDQKPSDETPIAKRTLTSIVLLLLLGFVLSGCATFFPRDVNAEKTITYRVWMGPPCVLETDVDGSRVQTVEGNGPDGQPNTDDDVKCRVEVDGKPIVPEGRVQ